MPGLVGIISLDWNNKVDFLLQDTMTQTISHRRHYKRMDVKSESRNYAISRIHHGIANNLVNPFINHDAQVTVIIEGEIYNDIHPWESESEFIFQLYRKKGHDFVVELDGSFLIIIIDAIERTIFIANDRTASRQLFFFQDKHCIYFSPETKSFLTIPTFNRTINEGSIGSFLSSGYIINQQCYFENVSMLDYSTILKIRDKDVTEKKYWSFLFNEEQDDRGLSYYAEKVGELISESLRNQLRGKRKLGILLSGGLDSRAIYGGFLSNNAGNDHVTLTWGTNDNIPFSDANCARQLSSIFDSEHHFFKLSSKNMIHNFNKMVFYSEGLTDALGNYPDGLEIFRSIRQDLNVDVIIRGDQCFGCGGDLVHTMNDILPAQNIYRFSEVNQYQKLIFNKKALLFNKLNNNMVDEVLAKCASLKLHNQKDYLHLDQRLQHLLNPLSYLKQIEIEQSNPLLSRDILELIKQIPYQHRINKKLLSTTVQMSFQGLSNIPIASKESDIDWEGVLKNNTAYRDFIKQTLLYEKNSFDEYINTKELSYFLDSYFGSSSKKSQKSSWESGYKIVKSKIKKISPLVKIVRSFKKPWSTDDTAVIFRLLTLKRWFEFFIDHPQNIKNKKTLTENDYDTSR